MDKNSKKKPIAERIEELKKQIAATSDKHQVQKLLDTLLTLQRQADIEPVELIVPVKEVKESIDFGACKISRTIRGFLFEAKGGLYTFVESRMQSIYTMLDSLFQLHNKENKTDDEKNMYNLFRDAVLYIFQAPIFASINEKMLFEISTDMLRHFNEYYDENYTNAKPHDETEEDIKANNEFENVNEAIQTLVDSPLPKDI